MVFKFLCTTVEKHCKLSIGMQRPTVNHELSKGRFATCKERISMMSYRYMHAYNVAS